MPKAVTEEAPAASEIETPGSLDESLGTGFLSDDPHYRLTGEFKPEEKTEEKKEEKKEEIAAEKPLEVTAPSGEQDAETAAASEPAPQQEQPHKTAQTSESRWAKLSRENRDLRDRLARLEGRSEAREPERKSPAADTKPQRPKIDDVDAAGKPKFSTYEDYENARDEWNRKEAIREFQETSSKTQREQQQAQAEQVIAKTWKTNIAKVAKELPDYNEVCFPKDDNGNDLLHIPVGSLPDQFFLKSPHGARVLYEVAKNHPEILETATENGQVGYVMAPIDQLRELSKVELRVSGEIPAPVRQVTQAPRPPHQVSGKGTVAKDAIEQALEDGDSETYSRLQNARELASRKGK